MIKKILLVILVIIVGILIFAATRPNEFSVQRSVTIQASPEAIFPHLSNFHAWEAWSPRAKMDPNMQTSYSTNDSGVGATYAWEGNSKVGQGKMEYTQVSEPNRVEVKLEFLKPFKAQNRVEFTIVPNGDVSIVNWLMDGPSPYLSKLIGVFYSMDSMIGKDFEKGLADLKRVSES